MVRSPQGTQSVSNQEVWLTIVMFVLRSRWVVYRLCLLLAVPLTAVVVSIAVIVDQSGIDSLAMLIAAVAGGAGTSRLVRRRANRGER